MINKSALFLVVLVVALFTCVNSSIAEKKELVIGISTGYPPYYYQKDEKLQGICIEIVESVCSAMGLKITFKEYPWKRLLLVARKGEVDAILPLFKTAEREQFLNFGHMILAYEEVNFFVKKDSSLQQSVDFSDIYTKRIGVVSGYSYGQEFDSQKELEKVITQSDKHLLKMFEHNRFEVGVGNRFVVLYNAALLGILDKVSFLSPSLSKEPLYMGFTKKGAKAHLTGEFNQKLLQFKKSEKYQQILQKYGLE